MRFYKIDVAWLRARTATNERGCWVWLRRKLKKGYGLVDGGTDSKPETKYAHRLMWELVRGPIPPGRYVCHTCDNPSCINPEHLFIGTPQENHDDMVAKGRRIRPVPTKEQVAEMRRLRLARVSGNDIAVRLGFTKSTVLKYVRDIRVGWCRSENRPPPAPRKCSRCGNVGHYAKTCA